MNMVFIKSTYGAYLMMLGLVVLLAVTQFVSADDDYFLKAPKSVPRIGRRSEFFKSSNSLPRMARAGPPAALIEGREWGHWPWFRTNDNRPGPSRRSDDSQARTYSWSSIDRLMEEQPELWTPELLQGLKSDWEIQERPKRNGQREEPQN